MADQQEPVHNPRAPMYNEAVLEIRDPHGVIHRRIVHVAPSGMLSLAMPAGVALVDRRMVGPRQMQYSVEGMHPGGIWHLLVPCDDIETAKAVARSYLKGNTSPGFTVRIVDEWR